jgi:predicted nucleic acid-binding protein
MRTLVVDANVVMSALITAGGKAASVLLQPPAEVKLVSCHFLQIELFKHKSRIEAFSGLSEAELLELLYELLSGIEFINEAYIPFACWQQAHRLLLDVDPNDVPYVALAIHLNASLWTGDRKLLDGLAAKGFENCVQTAEVLRW